MERDILEDKQRRRQRQWFFGHGSISYVLTIDTIKRKVLFKEATITGLSIFTQDI